MDEKIKENEIKSKKSKNGFSLDRLSTYHFPPQYPTLSLPYLISV
jgi:hypothetical protein